MVKFAQAANLLEFLFFSGEFEGISSGLNILERDERTLVICKQLSLLSLFNPYTVSVYYVYKGWYYTHLRSYVWIFAVVMWPTPHPKKQSDNSLSLQVSDCSVILQMASQSYSILHCICNDFFSVVIKQKSIVMCNHLGLNLLGDFVRVNPM